MVDYLIVGFGLAGFCFAETVTNNNKSVYIVDSAVDSASRVAAGLINPVVLKRYTPVWKADEQMDLLQSFYDQVENKYKEQFLFPNSILRKFNSVEEQNNWYTSSDKVKLSRYLDSNIHTCKYSFIDSPYHFGQVNETGFLKVSQLLDKAISHYSECAAYVKQKFDYKSLEVFDSHVIYNGIVAKHIIFAEGFGMINNPYFNHLPLDGTKGEVLTIKATQLQNDKIIKAGVFIMPLGNSLYRVGATYNWNDKDNIPSVEGKNELVSKLKNIIDCDFSIVGHEAEIRPTVNDRRPLVGKHADYSNIYLLNGLGTRGVMLGPYLSKCLFDSIELGTVLEREIAIDRFSS